MTIMITPAVVMLSIDGGDCHMMTNSACARRVGGLLEHGAAGHAASVATEQHVPVPQHRLPVAARHGDGAATVALVGGVGAPRSVGTCRRRVRHRRRVGAGALGRSCGLLCVGVGGALPHPGRASARPRGGRRVALDWGGQSASTSTSRRCTCLRTCSSTTTSLEIGQARLEQTRLG